MSTTVCFVGVRSNLGGEMAGIRTPGGVVVSVHCRDSDLGLCFDARCAEQGQKMRSRCNEYVAKTAVARRELFWSLLEAGHALPISASAEFCWATLVLLHRSSLDCMSSTTSFIHLHMNAIHHDLTYRG